MYFWRNGTLRLLGLIWVVLITGLPSHEADARVRWTTPGSYRVRILDRTGFVTGSDGIQMPHQLRGTHRLRLEPLVEVGAFRVLLGLDVLTGQVSSVVQPALGAHSHCLTSRRLMKRLMDGRPSSHGLHG